VRRLIGITGEHALIERLLGRKGRLVAQQDVQEPQPLDVATNDDEADG
jgi:hypothetical protein